LKPIFFDIEVADNRARSLADGLRRVIAEATADHLSR